MPKTLNKPKISKSIKDDKNNDVENINEAILDDNKSKYNLDHPMNGVSKEGNTYRVHYDKLNLAPDKLQEIKLITKKSYKNIDDACNKMKDIIISVTQETYPHIKYVETNIVCEKYKPITSYIDISSNNELFDIATILSFLEIKNKCEKFNNIIKQITFFAMVKNEWQGFKRVYLCNMLSIKKILQITRNANKIMLMQLLNIDVDDYIFLEKEVKTLHIIKQIFKSDEQINQFSCGIYRIDLYMPQYKIAIECDEFGHTDRNMEYEKERQTYIMNTLNCTFVRYNPDAADFNIFDVCQIIYDLIKKSLQNKDRIVKSILSLQSLNISTTHAENIKRSEYEYEIACEITKQKICAVEIKKLELQIELERQKFK